MGKDDLVVDSTLRHEFIGHKYEYMVFVKVQRVSADMTFRNPESESDFHFPTPELVSALQVVFIDVPKSTWRTTSRLGAVLGR